MSGVRGHSVNVEGAGAHRFLVPGHISGAVLHRVISLTADSEGSAVVLPAPTIHAILRVTHAACVIRGI